MKRFPAACLVALCLLSWAAQPATAQITYTPVAVTGFTDDVIANGRGPAASSTTNTVDFGLVNNRFSFVAPDYVSPTGATVTTPTPLPLNGLISSSTTSGLWFQLASYSANNSLRIAGTGSGSLSLTTPQPAQTVYVAAATGNGDATVGTDVTMTVFFTDGSSEAFTRRVFDWYAGPNVVVGNLSRVNRDNDVIDARPGQPNIYQHALLLSTANWGKPVSRVLFSKTQIPAGATILNVFNGLAITLASSCGLPTGTVQPAAATVCPGQAQLLTATLVGGSPNATGQWQSSTDGLTWTGIVGATATTYSATPTASTQYRYHMACNAALQSNAGPVTVTVAMPRATLTYGAAEYCRTGTTGVPTFTPAGGTFSARPGLALNATTGEADLTTSVAGDYTVTYRSGGQCLAEASATFTIKSDALPIFPNVITPNGDGVNDGLRFRFINPDVTDFQLQVYNRWGRKMWSGTNPALGWAAEKAGPGVYYYQVDYTDCAGHKQHYKGTVEVIK